MVEETADLLTGSHRVHEAAQGAQGQPVGQPVLDPGTALPFRTFREPMAVLPARERPVELRVHEAVWRVELADDHAPAPGQPRGPEVEDGARGQPRGRRRQPARSRPRGVELLEVARVGEELEHHGAGTRKPHAALENVVRHGGRAIIGGCRTPGQTRAYLALTLISALWGSYPAFAKLALAHFPPYVPVVGVVLAWAILREAVEWPEIVGGALVLLGVALTTQAPLAPRPAS